MASSNSALRRLLFAFLLVWEQFCLLPVAATDDEDVDMGGDPPESDPMDDLWNWIDTNIYGLLDADPRLEDAKFTESVKAEVAKLKVAPEWTGLSADQQAEFASEIVENIVPLKNGEQAKEIEKEIREVESDKENNENWNEDKEMLEKEIADLPRDLIIHEQLSTALGLAALAKQEA